MEQVVFGGYYDALYSFTSGEWNSLQGGHTWLSVESRKATLVSTDGIIKYLRVVLSGSPGAGNKYIFTLYVNGAPTALTFDIEDLETSGSNMVNEIDVTGGDTVSLQYDQDSFPTARYATWTCVFEGDTAKESLIMGGTTDAVSNSATEYGQVMCAYTSFSGVENNFRQVVPTAGTIKNFYVLLEFDPGTINVDAYRFTVRLNGATVAQSLIVTIVANNTSGNDLVHNLVVAADDILTMMIEPLNVPATTPRVRWGMTFVADTDGESIVLGGSTDNLSNAATEYTYLTSNELQIWTANENERYQLGQICTIKKLYILLSAAPGAGNSYTFSLDIVGDSNTVAAIVADAATTGNSGALEDAVANDDYVTLKVVPDDTPDAADAYWGFVGYIAPPVSGVGMGAKPPIMELLIGGVI